MPLSARHLALVGLAVLGTGLAIALLLALPDAGAVWSRLVAAIQATQRDLYRQLAMALQTIQAHGVAAAWGLISLSFLYGIFHAAGPGHGKVIISTYLLTHESQLRRGLMLSAASSLMQAATAIVAVEVTIGLLGHSMRRAQATTAHLELASFAVVALVGAYLVATRARRLLRFLPVAGRAHDHDHAHDHAHAHGHAPAADDWCGHRHATGAHRADDPAASSVRGMLGLIASVGLRPCSGAVIVLAVSFAMGLRWAGHLSVLAMAVGTALTVSAIAVLAVYARRTSQRLAERLPGRGSRLGLAADTVALLGGAVILLAGLLLLYATWTAPAHPLM